MRRSCFTKSHRGGQTLQDTQPHLCQSQDQSQNQEDEENALPGMEDDGEPVAAVAPAGEGQHQTGEDIPEQPPRLVEMIQPEEDAVGDPIPSSKDALHLWQQHPAEQEFFSEESVEYR